MFDFPSSPTTGQVFNAPTGQGYVYSGTAWNLAQTSPQAPVASDNPPANPYAGQLWLRSTTGALYCWYTDPNSSQWIQIPGIAPVNDPYAFNVANMQLRSKAAGSVALNSAKDGSGTDAIELRNNGSMALNLGGGIVYTAEAANQVAFRWGGSGALATTLQMNIDAGALISPLWSTNNTALTKGNPGYLKLPNGLILQWNYYAGNGSDIALSFPTAFPTIAATVFAQPQGSPPTNNAWTVTIDQVTATSFAYRPRAIGPGAVNPGAIPCYWLAIGW